MSNRLDQRIRRLVVEVVDASPPPPRLDELELPAPQRRPTRRIVVVAVAALTVVALAFGAAWLVRDERSAPTPPAGPAPDGVVRIPLDSIPQGVTARAIDGRPVFIDREGERITTFLTDVKHLPDERELWWCPRESVFASPTHGEAFGRDGHAIGGPAFTGLDELGTQVLDGVVAIDPQAVVADGTPNEQTFRPPDVPWDAGNDSFCSDAVVSGDRVDVESLPTLYYSAQEYTVPAGVVDIHFRSAGGSHTLAFEQQGVEVFGLRDPGGPSSRAIELEPGAYTIHCSIPGHRDAGEEATIVVTP